MATVLNRELDDCKQEIDNTSIIPNYKQQYIDLSDKLKSVLTEKEKAIHNVKLLQSKLRYKRLEIQNYNEPLLKGMITCIEAEIETKRNQNKKLTQILETLHKNDTDEKCIQIEDLSPKRLSEITDIKTMAQQHVILQKQYCELQDKCNEMSKQLQYTTDQLNQSQQQLDTCKKRVMQLQHQLKLQNDIN